MKTIQEQFEEITLMRLFEIQVIDKRTNEIEYIIFEIEINGNLLKATHEGLTQEQRESNKIAFVSVEIDECFSLDEHLENLYSECINAIMNSEFFELTEN
jgi:hypothetical protein